MEVAILSINPIEYSPEIVESLEKMTYDEAVEWYNTQEECAATLSIVSPDTKNGYLVSDELDMAFVYAKESNYEQKNIDCVKGIVEPFKDNSSTFSLLQVEAYFEQEYEAEFMLYKDIFNIEKNNIPENVRERIVNFLLIGEVGMLGRICEDAVIADYHKVRSYIFHLLKDDGTIKAYTETLKKSGKYTYLTYNYDKNTGGHYTIPTEQYPSVLGAKANAYNYANYFTPIDNGTEQYRIEEESDRLRLISNSDDEIFYSAIIFPLYED